MEVAKTQEPPWLVHDLKWGDEFIAELLAGDSTDTTLVEHFASKTLGAGDLTILVEGDRYAKARAVAKVSIWTIDDKLDAYRA